MNRRPPRPRRYVSSLPRYVAGGPARRPDGRPGYKLSSNESPYPVLDEMVEAITEAAREGNRYPPDGRQLAERLALIHSVPADRVLISGGSLELLRDLLTAFAGHGTEVVLGWRSYEAYPILVQSTGARARRVPLLEFRLDLDGLAAAIGPRTRVVLLANPNNPTGTVVPAEAITSFARRLPPSCLLILDEAYSEFGDPQLGPHGIWLALAQPNVVVLRTFSKAGALAGLRVGWGVADRSVVEAVRQVALPFTLTAVAQAAALSALQHQPELGARVRITVAERERVRAELNRLGFEVPQSQGNFLWLPLGEGSRGFSDSCSEAGVGLRCFPGEGVRVTIGAPLENDAALEAARGYLEGPGRRLTSGRLS